MHSILRHRKLVGSVILRKFVLNISRFTIHYLRFPPSLDLAISMFSALAGGMPELANVMSTQVVLECLAHKWQFNPRTSSAIYWSFVHVPAHLLAALITSLVAYAIMLAGRGEFQFRHLGMLRYCFLANAMVLPAFLLPTESRRVWQSDEPYLGHHIFPPRPACTMAPLASNGLADYLLAGQTTRAAFLLFGI